MSNHIDFKKQNIPFTMVANSVLYDKNLSVGAKCLFAYLYSKPEGWDFSSDRIGNELNISKPTVLKLSQELEENGYLQRERQSTGRVLYIVIYPPYEEKPQSKNFTMGEKPQSKKATVKKSHGEESLPISNTVFINNTDIINKTEYIYIGEFKNVKITEEEIQKLNNLFNEKNTAIIIEELSAYIASKNKRYSNHYATLLNWGKRKIENWSKNNKHSVPTV